LAKIRRDNFPQSEDVDLGVAHGDENFLLFKVQDNDDLPDKVHSLQKQYITYKKKGIRI